MHSMNVFLVNQTYLVLIILLYFLQIHFLLMLALVGSEILPHSGEWGG